MISPTIRSLWPWRHCSMQTSAPGGGGGGGQYCPCCAQVPQQTSQSACPGAPGGGVAIISDSRESVHWCPSSSTLPITAPSQPPFSAKRSGSIPYHCISDASLSRHKKSTPQPRLQSPSIVAQPPS